MTRARGGRVVLPARVRPFRSNPPLARLPFLLPLRFLPLLAPLEGCTAPQAPAAPGGGAPARAGSWSVALGPAAITPNFDEGGVSGALEVGYYRGEHIAVVLRHVGDYEDDGVDTSAQVTRLGFDWSPHHGAWQAFGGLSGGAAYGESVNESALFGVHLGGRHWPQPRAFLQVLLAYDRFLTRTEDETEYYRDGVFSVTVGIGMLF